MTKTDWTAEEVRDVAASINDAWCRSEPPMLAQRCQMASGMLTAFADRIEADERAGELCFTTDAKGNILAVTRTDSEGRILSVLAESPAQEQPGWKWVPVVPTQEMVDAAQFACGGNQGAYWAPESDDEWRAAIASAIAASPTPPKEK